MALAEAVTRLSDRSDAVPDEVWEEATRHYDEQTLGALVIQIALINFWNRLNAATRQIAGQWT
jgi:alkylhydroperoxidase family enzyme